MKLLNFTILKLTLFLCAGIIIAHSISIPAEFSIALTFTLLLTLSVAYLISKNQIKKTIWFGCIAFATTISLGILVYNFHNQKHFKNHYSKYISKTTNVDDIITLRIRERLKPGNSYNKYIVDILKINDEIVTGKSLLNVKIDSIHKPLKVDEIFISSSPFKALIHPLNPNQFDYKGFLEKQYIYHQLFTENLKIFKLSSQRQTLFGYADQLRQTINRKLKKYHFKPDQLAIINALLLGQRQDISEEIYNSYTRAGAIHILAVSGLHVGIVLLLLNFVFRPIEYLKHGRTIKVLLLLSTLWSFALIAGMSASVTRAVTMFSVVAIAMHWKRPTNVYNTLAISMFILLLFKPMFLFDVGFQLSYLAVFAIVSIQPLLYKLWKPRWKSLNFFWNILTVTIAAQFGIVPISLYYFHQFPSLFFISNLLIIPFLGFILAFGIIVILLALANMLPEFLASFYGYIIGAMNAIVSWVSQQERFLFKDIPFTILQVFSSYVLAIYLIIFIRRRTVSTFRWFLISIILLQGVFLYNTYLHSSKEFIIFHKSRFTLIGEKNNAHLKIYTTLKESILNQENTIKNYKVGNFISNIEHDSVMSVFQFNNVSLLVVDSFSVYSVKTFQPNFVLFTNSPKLNLNRLIDSLQPNQVIADGSNYKSYVDRWKRTCAERKIPFHNTSEKGAFILR